MYCAKLFGKIFSQCESKSLSHWKCKTQFTKQKVFPVLSNLAEKKIKEETITK